jgi:predicted Rossmann fold nucleotide-binding protein DprA/Smf involved in DNA uptake
MVKLAIIGSRSFNNVELFGKTLEPYVDKISLVISGGAKGADSLAEEWAGFNGINTEIYLPDWDKHGKRAGFIRNIEIIGACDAVIAFWDGESKGTAHSIQLAKETGKPVKIVRIDKPNFPLPSEEKISKIFKKLKKYEKENL